MFCNKCGTQNADGQTFCVKCGTPLNANPQQQQTVNQQQAPYQQQQAPYQQPQAPYQPPYQQPQSVPGKGAGIASMVLGIIALVLFCIWYISLPCGIIGVALGGFSLSKAKAVGAKSGVGTAGIACSCVALGLMIVFWILVAVGVASTEAYIDSLW